MTRILHIDMDAFFAAVEVAHDPTLAGKPLIIGGDESTVRGVVSTASYEAREFGVRSAMPLAEARRLCPHGIYMRGNHQRYREASQEVRRILETTSPILEFASIDEAYVDITASLKLFGGDESIARHIKNLILRELSLPCTVAVAANKLVAKVAANQVKPDGCIIIPEGSEAAYLRDLPMNNLPGVGPRTRVVLEAAGMKTIGDIAAFPPEPLSRIVGNAAYTLQQAAIGISNSTVNPGGLPKSISRETTFSHDLSDWKEVERVVLGLAEKAGASLRAEGLETRSITLKIRYAGFETKTHSLTLKETTCVDSEIFRVLRQLMKKAALVRKPVRLIGLNLSSLQSPLHQTSLFNPGNDDRIEQTYKTVDAVRRKHGMNSLRAASTLPPSDENLPKRNK
ncbi:MAG: DNA polymerase IV [Candidatus Hydrogenedentota bacterium]